MSNKSRQGRLILRLLEPNLALPTAKPPPESQFQLESSGLLMMAAPKSKLFADGNPNWKAVAAEVNPGLKIASCAHYKYEFAKVVAKDHGHSDVAGTQSQDVRWKNMERFIPSSIHTRIDRQVNPALEKYMYAWLWRHNLRSENFLEALAKLCQQAS